MPFLKIDNLSTKYNTSKGVIHALDDASFQLDDGESIGIAGESACGKSTLGLSIIRMIQNGNVSGTILFDDKSLLDLSESEFDKLIGEDTKESILSGVLNGAINRYPYICTQCGNGVCGLGENKCNCPQDCQGVTTCIKEGEIGFITKTIPDVCCSGLTKIGNDKVSDELCAVLTNGSFRCSYCGNGVCGLGENSCNCPSDCKINATTTPSITVVSPNGGEQWKFNNAYNINWASTGITGDVAGYLIFKNDSFACKVFQTKASTGQYSLTLQEGQSCPIGNVSWQHQINVGDYKLQIWSADETVHDTSDNYFSIVSDNAINACADTDGGKNYYAKGDCSAGTFGMWDYCSYQLDRVGILKEAFCSTNGCVREDYTCPQGQICRAGRCLSGSSSDPICVDTDNGDEYVKGETNSMNIYGATDSCYVSATLDRPAGALTSACSGNESSGYCGVYEYYDVPKYIYNDILLGDNPGKVLLKKIKGKYQYEKMN